MAKDKLLSLPKLTEYDAEIKALIDNKDAAVLASSKAYSDSLGVNYDPAGSAATALVDAKAHADSKDAAIAAAKKAGTDAQATADTANTIADAAKSAADAAQREVDALEVKVGVVPDGQNVMGIIKTIQDNAYDDTAIKALVSANTGKISTLVGTDTNKSVRKIANEELTAQLIPADAKLSLDTLAEISTWIQNHPDDASGMNKAINDLKALVGNIPADVTATTIVGYIEQVHDALLAEKTRAEAAEGSLDARLDTIEPKVSGAEEDIDTLQAAIGAGGSVTVAIADAKKAGTDAQAGVNALTPRVTAAETKISKHDTTIGSHTSKITALESKVGDGYEIITSAEISALFA